MKKIIILTCAQDIHTQAVCDILENNYGVEPLVLERETYGSEWLLSGTVVDDQVRSIIELRGSFIDASEVGSFWNRRDFTAETIKSGEDPEQRYIAMQTAIHVNGIVRHIARSVPVINHPDANASANSKFLQASVAAKHGLRIPESFYGGTPKIADRFINSIPLENRISIKPLEAVHLKSNDGKTYAHYNNIFKRRPLNELESLSQCPVILQRFIEKKLELRVTVVGDNLFAASIDTSNANEEAKIDWRHYDWANTPYFKYEIPTEIKSSIMCIMKDLKISYGAFDLILGKDDQYYFLEVNPQGQWLWVEDLTDLPITDSIASWLYENAKHGKIS